MRVFVGCKVECKEFQEVVDGLEECEYHVKEIGEENDAQAVLIERFEVCDTNEEVEITYI